MTGLDTIPETLSDALGISQDAAEVLVSAMVMLVATICIALVLHSRNINDIMVPLAAVNIALMGFFTMIAWLDPWLLILIAILLVIIFSTKMREVFTKQG